MSRRPEARPAGPAAGAVLAAAVLALASAPAGSARAPRPVIGLPAADRTIAEPPGPARDATLREWARTAPLPDLMYVLRRPAAELGAEEGLLVRAALARCPTSRADLRRRLELRLALADPRARRELGRLAEWVPDLPVRPRASVFRLGLLLPDSGRYAAYGLAVEAGIAAALADANSVSLRPIEISRWSTGDDRPDRAAAAVDSATVTAGILVGELLSVPTFTVASGARLLRIPLVSPTATDEHVGRAGPSIFQVGPSGTRRGVALGRVVLRDGHRRVGVLVADDLGDSPLARGFEAVAESSGIEVAYRGTFTPGASEYRALARAIGQRKLDALLFDGDARDARVLLGQLARDGANLAICGGEAFAPDRYPNEARLLLEGVRWVGEDWTVPAGVQARLDSVAAEIGEERSTSLFVRGYYAGRLVAAGVHAGALAPEELGTWLRNHLDPLPEAAAAGFLDCMGESAKLPVWMVERGRVVPAP